MTSKTKQALKEIGWDKPLESSTSSEEVLGILTAASHVLEKPTGRYLTAPTEREAVLFFEELHMRDIRNFEVKLLEISRGSKDASNDKLHLLLHSYSQ
jgi:hypothetical protein